MYLPQEFLYVILTSRGTVSITLDLFATIETTDIHMSTVIHDRTYPERREQFSIVAPVGWEKELRAIDSNAIKTWNDGSFLFIQNRFGKLKLAIKNFVPLWTDKRTAIDRVYRDSLLPFLEIEDDFCRSDAEGVHTSKGIVSIPAFKVEGRINVGNIKKLLSQITQEEIRVWQGENRIIFTGIIDGNIKGMSGLSVQI